VLIKYAKNINQLIEGISAVQFFQITALCFGLAIVFIIPPFQVPDEPDHFERAFHLAGGHFFGTQQNHRLGGEVPESIVRLEAIYQPIKFDYNAKQTALKFKKAKSIALNPETNEFQDFPNTGLYPFTVYLPQTLVAIVGKILNINPLYLLYIARLCTFSFWILLISKAIQIMPERKWELAFLALLPSSLFINASASGDVVTNGVAFLVLAFCYRVIILEGFKISFIQMGWLTFGVCILALNKFVYAPILLLSFLFPKTAFEHPKHRNQFALGLLFMAIIVVIIWNLKTSELFIPKDQYNLLFKDKVTLNEGVNPKEQFLFILNKPGQYLKIISLSFVETSQATMAHYFGKFGWEKNYLPTWMIGLLLLTTIFLSIQKSRFELSNKAKITFLIIAFIMSIGLATTLYMMWCPVGNERVLGLSGRYFIPVLPLVWLAFPGVINFRYKKLLIIIVTILALIIGLITAYERYY